MEVSHQMKEKKKEKEEKKKRSRLKEIRDIRNKVNMNLPPPVLVRGKGKGKKIGLEAVQRQTHLPLDSPSSLVTTTTSFFLCQAKTEVRHVNRHIQYEYQPLLTCLLACLLACLSGWLPTFYVRYSIHCISLYSREIE